MQMTRFAERAFMLDSEQERDEWIRAYADVKKRVMAQATAIAVAPTGRKGGSSWVFCVFTVRRS